jgi:hypothetical protein
MERTCFDVLAALFARDVDRELLRRAQAKTPTERILWLEEMQDFADAARKAGRDAPPRSSHSPR